MLGLFEDIIGEANPDTQEFIKIEGTYSYYVKAEVKGTLPYSNTSLIIQGFNSKKSMKPLKLKCRWYREIGERNYEITDNKDEMYHINAQDIGCFVKVAIRPKSKRYSKKDIAIVRFGPFQMSETLSLNLEKDLTNGTHIYQFNLLKLNSQFVNDQSGYQNFIKVDKVGISVQFGFFFELFENFFLLHNSAHPYRIACENHEYSVVSIFYKKGSELNLSENVLNSFPKLKHRYKKLRERFLKETINEKQDTSNKSLSQLSLDFNSQSRRNREQRRGSEVINNLQLDSYVFNIGDEEEDKEQELRIKFQSRVERDSFVCLIRSIAAIKTMTLAPLMKNISRVFDGTIAQEQYSNETVDIFDDKYERVLNRTQDYEYSIQRLLELNKNKNQENENLIQCAELLESDLAMSITEFKKILDKMSKKEGMVSAEKQKVAKLEQSLLNVSRNVELIRERSHTPSRRVKLVNNAKNNKIQALGGIQKEIDKTDKLNEILIQKIENLKVENTKLNEEGAKLKEKINQSMMGSGRKAPYFSVKVDEVNQSVLEGRSKEKEYLLNLDLGKKFEREKNSMDKEQLQRSDENDESILEEAIINLESSIMYLDDAENKGKKDNRATELELESEMLSKKVKKNKREFEKLMEISKQVEGGENFGMMSGVSSLAEKIFDHNGMSIKDLQAIILLHDIKSTKAALQLHEEKWNDDSLLAKKKDVEERTIEVQSMTSAKQDENNLLEKRIKEVEKEFKKQEALLLKEEQEKLKINKLSEKMFMLQQENFNLMEEEEA